MAEKRKRNKSTDRIMIVLSVLLMIVTAIQLGALWAQVRGIPQPITITACTPDSQPGQCDKWFDTTIATQKRTTGIVQQMKTDQVIRVVGETCNTSDTALSYRLEIIWASVDSPGTAFTVIESPITWKPGCTKYDFPFVVPESMRVLAGPGESLGKWVLAGAAWPKDNAIKPVHWTITDAVVIIIAEPSA